MKRPSVHTVIVASVSFIAGFIVAVALAGGLVLWFGRISLHATQGRVVDKLVTTNQLLAAADKPRGELRGMIVGDADEQSLTAAAMFDAMGSSYQPMVLRQFARMNTSTTLKEDQSTLGNAAKLARAMVLCTHHSAYPNWVTVNEDTGATMGVPSWVFELNAAPTIPATVTYGQTKFGAPFVQAAAKHWRTLHQWVMSHQDCAAARALN
ncbi:MAG: hypothetical protein OJF55_001992 [Rhodanobacteraceae bacterium]|jgi:hypothetical protein|nr:MAG: hypothetical protein OJF55_001992 [Rhodanobacteraceae bacterium]